MRRPLRSKRTSTSPVRARSKASGLTRIRVRLTAGAPFRLVGTAGRRLLIGGARGRLFSWRGRFLAGGFLASRRGALPGARRSGRPFGAFRLPLLRRAAGLLRGAAARALLERVLAVGADRP